MVDICFDDDRNLDDKDVIEYTASSPIRQYKLMKDFRKFAGEIYPKALFEYLDSGMTYIIMDTNVNNRCIISVKRIVSIRIST